MTSWFKSCVQLKNRTFHRGRSVLQQDALRVPQSTSDVQMQNQMMPTHLANTQMRWLDNECSVNFGVFQGHRAEIKLAPAGANF